MSTPFNEDWLEMGVCVPVDIETTAILLKEIKQLRHDAWLEKQWVGLTKWEREAIALECGAMSADWLVVMKAVERALREKNT